MLSLNAVQIIALQITSRAVKKRVEEQVQLQM